MKKCPKCKDNMKLVQFDAGYGVTIESLHCNKCGFNITEEGSLENAIGTLKENMSREIKVVQIGNGLGIRIPNEIAKNLNIHKGDEIIVKPDLNGIRLVTDCKHHLNKNQAK